MHELLFLSKPQLKSKQNWIWSNWNRNRIRELEFGFGLAENRNLIFGFGFGYAEIGFLAEISAETEILDTVSAKIAYFAEVSGLFDTIWFLSTPIGPLQSKGQTFMHI